MGTRHNIRIRSTTLRIESLAYFSAISSAITLKQGAGISCLKVSQRGRWHSRISQTMIDERRLHLDYPDETPILALSTWNHDEIRWIWSRPNSKSEHAPSILWLPSDVWQYWRHSSDTRPILHWRVALRNTSSYVGKARIDSRVD